MGLDQFFETESLMTKQKWIFSRMVYIGLFFLSDNILADESQTINCNRGQSLVKAIQELEKPRKITIYGTCYGPIIIQRDDIILIGTSGAVITVKDDSDVVTIDGATRVSLRHLSIENGKNGLVAKNNSSVKIQGVIVNNQRQNGINLESNSSLQIKDSTLRNNAGSGLSLTGASSLKMLGKLESHHNGVFGIILLNSSSGITEQAQVNVHHNTLGIQVGIGSSFLVGDATSVVQTEDNISTGLTIVSGSSLVLFEGRLISKNNQFNNGLSVRVGSTVDMDRGASMLLENNGLDGILLENSQLNMFSMRGLASPQIHSLNNNRHGINAFLNSKIDLSEQSKIISQNNKKSGIFADNGSILTLSNSTITDNQQDISLSFGARAEFSNNTLGSIVCDDSVLVRGSAGITCPRF